MDSYKKAKEKLKEAFDIMGAESERSDAGDILYGALCAPIEQILENAGENVKEIRDEVCQCNEVAQNYGYDVKNKKFGDMYKMGIIDPTKVTKNALKNAVSVATTILTTNAIVTMKRKNG